VSSAANDLAQLADGACCGCRSSFRKRHRDCGFAVADALSDGDASAQIAGADYVIVAYS